MFRRHEGVPEAWSGTGLPGSATASALRTRRRAPGTNRHRDVASFGGAPDCTAGARRGGGGPSARQPGAQPGRALHSHLSSETFQLCGNLEAPCRAVKTSGSTSEIRIEPCRNIAATNTGTRNTGTRAAGADAVQRRFEILLNRSER
ncbi:hypothetical protein KNE206_60640 [Kitasatospora sp. NE20-6]